MRRRGNNLLPIVLLFCVSCVSVDPVVATIAPSTPTQTATPSATSTPTETPTCTATLTPTIDWSATPTQITPGVTEWIIEVTPLGGQEINE